MDLLTKENQKSLFEFRCFLYSSSFNSVHSARCECGPLPQLLHRWLHPPPPPPSGLQLTEGEPLDQGSQVWSPEQQQGCLLGSDKIFKLWGHLRPTESGTGERAQQFIL